MSFLDVENLSCGYNGKLILKGIRFKVMPGKIVALLGPNGSGKTTLIRSMCRLLKPAKGRILLNNRELKEYNARMLAKEIAAVHQNGSLSWPFTVHQIVSLGRFPHRGWISFYTKEDFVLIDNAIKITGLSEYQDRIIHTLSGGEAQRVMIARALAQNPKILLLDEPVAHLDIKYKIAILDLARKLADDGLAVVISLHDLNLAAMYADLIVLLNKGCIHAIGHPIDILTKENIEEVYETEVNVTVNPPDNRPFIYPVPSVKIM